jgi:hypothetical protein
VRTNNCRIVSLLFTPFSSTSHPSSFRSLSFFGFERRITTEKSSTMKSFNPRDKKPEKRFTSRLFNATVSKICLSSSKVAPCLHDAEDPAGSRMIYAEFKSQHS